MDNGLRTQGGKGTSGKLSYGPKVGRSLNVTSESDVLWATLAEWVLENTLRFLVKDISQYEASFVCSIYSARVSDTSDPSPSTAFGHFGPFEKYASAVCYDTLAPGKKTLWFLATCTSAPCKIRLRLLPAGPKVNRSYHFVMIWRAAPK